MKTDFESIDKTAEFWRTAFLIRGFEERLLKLFSEGKLFGTVHTCIGQEFSGVAVARQLVDGDVILSNHRCHGHYIARTDDVDRMMAEVMGRQAGMCGGRGGSQHICAHGVYSNGVQGGMAPIAAGMALSHKLRSNKNIVVLFIGDGTLGEGAVYEALNLCSKWELPVMVVLENNLYAQSTSQSTTLAGSIRGRAEAFGIANYVGSTSRPQDLHDVIEKAVAGVRATSRPAFVQVDTSRLMAHSKGDDDRPKDEVAAYWASDPLVRFEAEYPEIAASLKQDAEKRVEQAVQAALVSDFAENGEIEVERDIAPRWLPARIEGRERVVNRIYHALKENLSGDDRCFLIGEDIEGPYGGAFKVSKDLSLRFPGRVRNTPISESLIAGVGNGMALMGMRPVCEIMFGDFMTLAFDQFINHAAKFRWMYNGQVSVPVILRTPMGGRRGYGATHSQSLEKHFLGVPGTRVLALHPRFDPALVYEKLFSTIDRPTLVIENKTMYGEYATHETNAGFQTHYSDEDFPVTRIGSASQPDISLICYGGMLREAEKAAETLFEQHEIVAEIICPIQIYPLRVSTILESARRSGRMLVIEEGQAFCGFGAELIASLQGVEGGKEINMRRLGAKPHPLAASKAAELDSLPGADNIVALAVEMVSHG